MGGIADAVIRHTSLGEVIGTDLRRTVASRDETLAAAGDVVHIFLMLLIINKGIQAREGTLLILGLVARLRTFDENLLRLTRIGIFPHITQTDTRLHLIHVLTTGT